MRFIATTAALLFAVACTDSGKKAVDIAVSDNAAEKESADLEIVDLTSGPQDTADAAPDRADTEVATGSDVRMGSDIQNHGACCQVHADCTSALICVGATDEHDGTCESKPNGSICYFDVQCDEFEICHGAEVCSCDANCPTIAGKCVPVTGGCCETDDECPTGMRCVGDEETGGGVCLIEPDHPLKCWEDEDCAGAELCVHASWCGCAYYFCDPPEMGYCQDAALTECVEKYSGCECEQGCADGFWTVVFYDEILGEFPPDMSPPPELLAQGLAKYDCSVCQCNETWQINLNGQWVSFEGGPEEFCTMLFAMDGECGGCLTTWEGGCC